MPTFSARAATIFVLLIAFAAISVNPPCLCGVSAGARKAAPNEKGATLYSRFERVCQLFSRCDLEKSR
jgi:hypothetical protein